MEIPERRRRLRWVREFIQLSGPYFKSPGRNFALLLIGVHVAAVLLNTYIFVRAAAWNQEIYNAVSTLKWSEIQGALLSWLWIFPTNIAFSQISEYTRYRLRIHWREWMTKQLTETWLKDRKPYVSNLAGLQRDNPDQRIAEDVEIFVTNTVGLGVSILYSATGIVTFTAVLWGLSGKTVLLGVTIPGYFVWLALIYAMAANFLIYRVGRRQIRLEYEQQRCEANLRFALVRIRTNTESIALAQGEAAEFKTVSGSVSQLVNNFLALNWKMLQVRGGTLFHSMSRPPFVYLAAVPKVLSGAMNFGGIMQINTTFNNLEDAIAVVANSFNSITHWRAATARLVDFNESLKRTDIVLTTIKSKSVITTDHVNLSGLSIQTPDHRTLLQDFSTKFEKGTHVLLVGPSGSGKSTVLRVIAGVWPYFKGQVGSSKTESQIFLTQSAYLPIATLREALLYPHYDTQVDDGTFQALLTRFNLSHLCEKLATVEDWQATLSPGECQRVVLIRAILQKPAWLFMDESTSALDSASQELAYRILHEMLPETTIVSVGHRQELEEFHDCVIYIGPANGNQLVAS